ncbi:MAG: DUF1800 domain-containing protein [Planctomycetia bacterium]|nr:DUF1800 domain-containing protein [Planctomycetia bacterium]
MNRRDFIKAGSAASALLATGCEKLRGKVGDWFLGAGVPDRFAVAAAGMDEHVHLLNRAAFGPWPGDLERVAHVGADKWIEEQLFPDSIDDLACQIRTRGFETLHLPPGEMYEYKKPVVEKELTRFTLLRAVYSKRQLFEVLVEFWTDHFNIHIGKADCAWLKSPDDRDTIRAHALGRFRDMVKASALSPAMLVYLDGRENRKAGPGEKPNENYARELLELHTLGVHGGYTQKDVMEVARCLTGWTCRRENQLMKAKVEFHRGQHDDGEKTVLGRRIAPGGMENDLEQVLDIVCSHPSTANYIAEKLCRRFIGDAPPASAVAKAAKTFQDTSGSIRSTVKTVLTCEEFRASKGQKLKRPFRFVVSALRALGADTNASPALLRYLGAMGQAPFQHPTPDGYPDEAMPWLGTMLWRWNFALALVTNNIGGTSVDLPRLAKAMSAPESDPAPMFLRLVLGREPLPVEQEAVASYLSASPLEPHQKRAEAVGLMLASPGFQRC